MAASSEDIGSAHNKNLHSLSEAYETYLRNDQEEQYHWEDVCRAYRQYAVFAMAQWASRQYRLHSLPQDQRKYLPEGMKVETEAFATRAKSYKEAAIRNQFCLDCILRHAGQPHSQAGLGNTNLQFSDCSQMSKVSSVLKSLMRDWSKEGRKERDMTYKPILELLTKYAPLHVASSGSQAKDVWKVCVPGAGVGRLACEISSLGYEVQGNEFSLYMLLASDYLLNGAVATPDHPLKISPFLLETRDVFCCSDPCSVCHIPDTDSFRMLRERRNMDPEIAPDFSMAAGDFVSIYNRPEEASKWDVVVSCFFLDTSPSVVEYLQVIHRMLRPDGLFINLGPLHWHWSGPPMRPNCSFEQYCSHYSHLDKRYLFSVDLSWEDIRAIMVNMGFTIVEEVSNIPSRYTGNEKSMIHTEYQCVKVVARKSRSDEREVDDSKSRPPGNV